MTGEPAENKALEVVRAFIRALEQKDFTAACALVSNNIEYDNVPMGKVFGPEAITSSLHRFMSPATRVEWQIHREGVLPSATGHTVFNERTDIFEFTWGTLTIPVAGVFDIENGAITLWRDYFDLQTFQKQMPAPSS